MFKPMKVISVGQYHHRGSRSIFSYVWDSIASQFKSYILRSFLMRLCILRLPASPSGGAWQRYRSLNTIHPLGELRTSNDYRDITKLERYILPYWDEGIQYLSTFSIEFMTLKIINKSCAWSLAYFYTNYIPVPPAPQGVASWIPLPPHSLVPKRPFNVLKSTRWPSLTSEICPSMTW